MSKAKTLKRSECSVLHLPLKRTWYDMIASGEKKEEYRAVKDYYRTRISNFVRRAPLVSRKSNTLVVAFSCGRRKADMYFTVVGVNIYPNRLHPEWGEPKGDHYVIALGRPVTLVDDNAKSEGGE